MAINVFVKGGGAPLEEISAAVGDVLTGKTYNDSEGEVKTGTMPNRGTINTTVAVGGTYTNSNAGYYTSIKVTGPTLSGNATAAVVRSGYTFYAANGTKQTGTLVNRGAVNTSVGVGGTYTNTNAGYYTSIKVTGPTLSGNAPASAVRSGYTFYAANGTKQTGTLATKTPSATTVPNGGSVTGAAGYYAAFTIKATYAVQRKTVAMNGYWNNSGIAASGYWGASAANTSSSFKLVSSGGYIWHTRNAGSNCNLYITRAYTY